MTEHGQAVVGRVLRASTIGFDCGTRSSMINGSQSFGTFVKVPLDESGSIQAVGLIYTVRIDDDPLARELVMASAVDNSTLYDQRENRMVPVEIGVINVGFAENGRCFYNLPPRPPMSLTEVTCMDDGEIRFFTAQTDFIRLILNARDAQPDELLAAAINLSAECQADPYAYKVLCGRAAARLLGHDLKRLHHVLTLIAPPETMR
ncbi:MAG: hypothetical protein KME04_10595 [Pleurocapsa minor GSE-CHR-MK-17-07R]|jgi:hypothetical protein|nr:hypothetical protein [Pleurocapsa minor GSE-CHR-MK 17-07R]